jgi:hypothetical protein
MVLIKNILVWYTMGSTKDKKKKRRRRVRAPPPLSVKATNVPKAIPTAILLEQQNFGRLIKNARTAGLEINQPVYDRYQENIHMRSVLARHNRPDLGERLGFQARQMVRNLVLPRGHAPARENSQRVDVPATPAPAPAQRTPASPATPGEIKEEKTVTFAERLAEGAETAEDLTTPSPAVPVEGRKIEPIPLPKNSTPEAKAPPTRLGRELSQLDPNAIIDTPPTRKRVTRSAYQETVPTSLRLTPSQERSFKTPSRESVQELVSDLPSGSSGPALTPEQKVFEDLMNEML